MMDGLYGRNAMIEKHHILLSRTFFEKLKKVFDVMATLHFPVS